MVTRLNKKCDYFPCHTRLSDCTFCYCPFYPCKDKHFGKYIVTRGGRKIWSCKDCNWIHNKNIVDRIFNMIRGSNLRKHATITKLMANDTGVIILGHGSKLEGANETVRRVAAQVKKKIGLDIVESAFLQLCKPDLKETIKKVAEVGCKKVVIVPFFLFMGNHASMDIPNAIKQEAKFYKDIEFIYAKNIGQDPRINDIVADCVREVI